MGLTVTPRSARSTARRPGCGRTAAFTFLEVLVVMAVIAILMGIGVGYLQSLGAASRADQARGILLETIYACQQSSNGGTRAIFDLRRTGLAGDELVVGAAVARPVLTHNFENVDSVSSDYPLEISGKVETVEEGHTGRAASFGERGVVSFAPQSAFAVTEGLEIDLWIRPEPGAPTMTLLEADGAYGLQLARDPQVNDYDLVLYLHLRRAGDDRRTAGLKTEFRTKGAPVRVGRGWTRIQAGFDGYAPSLRVDGIERYQATSRRRRSPSGERIGPEARTIVVPAGGAVSLTLSAAGRPYVGLMDTLVLGGVFRSRDVERDVTGLRLVRFNGAPFEASRLRIVYHNGRLDQAEHDDDQVLEFEDVSNPEGPPLVFRLERYGPVEADFKKEER